MSLDIRTASIQVQSALVDAIDLAFRRRYPEAATLADLSAVDSEKLPDRALVFVLTEGVVYRLSKAQTMPVALPDVVPTLSKQGRWLRQSSSVTLGPNYFRPIHRERYGYAATVQAYQGEDDEMLARIFAQRPAFLVQLLNDEYRLSGQRQGGIYAAQWKFMLHASAWNLRHGTDALYGSEVEEDAVISSERGVYRMIGDLRYLLAGSDLGLGIGVKFCSIDGSANLAVSDLSQRYFRAEVDLTVHGTVHRVDEDLAIPEVWVERYETSAPVGKSFDRANYVAQGLSVQPSGSLLAAPAAGVAYIGGTVLSLAPGMHLFAADKDTYRDLLPSGVFVYQDTEIGAPAPDQIPGALRVGVTRTSSTAIIGDSYLCSYRLTSAPVTGDPFKVS
jgi:phage gp37-like protein